MKRDSKRYWGCNIMDYKGMIDYFKLSDITLREFQQITPKWMSIRHVIRETNVPWWLRVRYENELSFELERKKAFEESQNARMKIRYPYPVHGRLRDVELELTL